MPSSPKFRLFTVALIVPRRHENVKQIRDDFEHFPVDDCETDPWSESFHHLGTSMKQILFVQSPVDRYVFKIAFHSPLNHLQEANAMGVTHGDDTHHLNGGLIQLVVPFNEKLQLLFIRWGSGAKSPSASF